MSALLHRAVAFVLTVFGRCWLGGCPSDLASADHTCVVSVELQLPDAGGEAAVGARETSSGCDGSVLIQRVPSAI